jgi:5-oxoprolinase (ATP-hydrolysing) subunit A
MLNIDLNCDMGESFGSWKLGNDVELMNYVSSINVACGFHAGDARTMRETVQIAQQKGVAIGAHPSFPDLQGFGRREMRLSNQEIFDIVLLQVSALKGICEAYGTKLKHVKPHGALYNLSAKNVNVSKSIAEAVIKIDKTLVLYGLSGSLSISEAKKIGLNTASEVFADRTYQKDGILTPRNESNALIHSTEQSLKQVLQMILDKQVTAVTGETISITAETICIHGDGEHSVEFAKTINRCLSEKGILIRAI